MLSGLGLDLDPPGTHTHMNTHTSSAAFRGLVFLVPMVMLYMCTKHADCWLQSSDVPIATNVSLIPILINQACRDRR